MRFSARAMTFGAALVALLAVSTPAVADEPFRVENHVEDRTSQSVLADGEAEIEEATRELAAQTDYDLFVVYVDSFDGMSGESWAIETAKLSGLGSTDLLLAVAVEDRAYGLSEASGIPIAAADIEPPVEDRLAADDWTGAAVAAVDVLSGNTSSGGGSEDGGGFSLFGPILVVALVLIVGFFVVRAFLRSRNRTSAGQVRPGSAEVGQSAAAPVPDKYASLSLEDLGKRAGAALVGLDDAVRSSEQELGFAEAQFGLQAIQKFRDTVESAKKKLGTAFSVQNTLDSAATPSEVEQRAGLTEILTLCEQADTELDQQAEAFEHLRNMQDRAPQYLDEISQRAAEITETLPPAEHALTQLHTVYPATALKSIAKAPDQARQLLEAAGEAVHAGRAQIQAQDRGSAVAYARTAEDALGQAVSLIESVHQGSTQLADARTKLAPAIASIRADLVDADKLAADDAAVQGLLPGANKAITQAEAAREAGDPIAALAELSAAEDALDDALAAHREQAEVEQRAAAKLPTGLDRTEQLVHSVNSYIETHRGAIGREARTKLADAAGLLSQARAAQNTQPQAAIARLNQAWTAASQARDAAQADVQRWQAQRAPQFMNSGYHGRSGAGSGAAIAVGSLLLGGILGEVLDGDDHSGFGASGFGGSGFGGGGGDFGGGFGGGGGRF